MIRNNLSSVEVVDYVNFVAIDYFGFILIAADYGETLNC